MPVAPQITQAVDDVSPNTGAVYYGDYTNDTAPLIHVSLGDQAVAGGALQLSDNGQAIGPAVPLTDAQVAQGYADVPLSGLPDGWNLLTATLRGADGTTLASSASFALGVATAIPAAPTIVSADDDAGAATGSLHDGARTDDATPTFHVYEPGLPPAPTGSPGHAPYGGPALLGGHLQLYENGQVVGDAVLGFDGTVTITPGALSPGDHVLTAVAVDRAGNASQPSAAFHLTIGPDAGGPDTGGTSTGTAQPIGQSPTNGDDLLLAGPGFLEVHGGAGRDTIQGADVADVLRGEQGDDLIRGGTAYNEINGNQGEDTILGRSAVGDSLMGGQGNDLIDASGSTGRDSINGNLGDDLIHGGSGGGMLWGGQGDDVIVGGSGADWISGDKGRNLLTGGAGADVFHAAAPGYSLVTDFSLAQGDRVQVDAGVSFHVSQSGANTLIDLSGGGQMVLAGVDSASLTGGWIFQA